MSAVSSKDCFRLSKTSYLQGRQCPLRLWLAAQGIEESPPDDPDESADDVLAEWELVEQIAESLFTGGVRVPDQKTSANGPDDQLARTRELMADPAVPAVFQAWFATDTMIGRIDILVRSPNGWVLYEVKASSAIKPQFIYDLAFQRHLITECGHCVARARVLHLNREYVYVGEPVHANKLLLDHDCTEAVHAVLAEVRHDIDAFQTIVNSEQAPDVRPSLHCKGNSDAKEARRPSDCGHRNGNGFCGNQLPANWIFHLPRVSGEEKLQRLMSRESHRIEDLDADDEAFNWSELQQRVIRAVKSGREYVAKDLLRKSLASVRWPVAYIDFEFESAIAVPRFEGMRPNHKLPFQWAIAVQGSPQEGLEIAPPFLHESESDPRKAFIESLLKRLPDMGTVVVHSQGAEASVLKHYKEWFGGRYAAMCNRVIERMFDTHKLARESYYHADLKGSFSIKKLAPVLIGKGYDHLAIHDGMAAVREWRRLIAPDTSTAERNRIRDHLTAYCQQDATLMHEIMERFRGMAV